MVANAREHDACSDDNCPGCYLMKLGRIMSGLGVEVEDPEKLGYALTAIEKKLGSDSGLLHCKITALAEFGGEVALELAHFLGLHGDAETSESTN